MYILGIDTSFDDTAAAVTQDTAILSNVMFSELPIYQEWGGVVPSLARRSHQDHIDRVIASALKRSGISMEKIDAIAVTFGPGLAISLEVGIAKAKELAHQYSKPLIAINHMEGHLLSVLAHPKKRQKNKMIDAVPHLFPAMGILVSGKHTQFVYTKAIGTYEIVGETQDDALGEAMDKVGRMLGLGYPAGSLIETLAKRGVPKAVVFPVPMRQVKDANTSYSGLKTAATRTIEPIQAKRGGILTKQDIYDVAYGFQDAALTHLIEKLEMALEGREVRSLILGGGVAANIELRKRLRALAKQQGLELLLPYTKKLCVDNAAMIGVAASFKTLKDYITDIDSLERNPIARLE